MEDDGKVEKMNRNGRLKAVEGVLCYFEQQGASAADILCFHCVCDKAAYIRTHWEKQLRTISFFLKK